MRRDELAALRSAAEAGSWTLDALGPVLLDGTALESVRMEDGAAVLSLRGRRRRPGCPASRWTGLGCTPCPGGGAPGPACSTPNIWAPAGTRATPAWGGADMLRIREAIVVEGRYDKNTLSQMVDTVIVETSGFGIFKDKERLALLRRLAEKRGLIVLTDPDGAGFVIRRPPEGEHPTRAGEARLCARRVRQRAPQAPGWQGGQAGGGGYAPRGAGGGVAPCGGHLPGRDGEAAPKRQAITKAELMALGLSGGPGAAERRKEPLHRLELARTALPNALLEVLNALFTFGELEDTVRGADAKKFS
ncbi:MAG: toprim domain-containing protein [Flavonifractor plautii]